MNERESLRTYGKFVVAQPRLSAHEERVLFREFRAGNLRSQERIINSSLYLVVKEVWREIRAPLPVWDMIQAGTEGLIDATGAYDTESDAIFKAVAVFRIHAHLTNAIARDSNTIRIPGIITVCTWRNGEALMARRLMPYRFKNRWTFRSWAIRWSNLTWS
jgi:DNA-directed RNA polymerase sigma subunit (sigma70/sigma32)